MKTKRIVAALAAITLLGMARVGAAEESLLNVSYDPTRELWKSLNERFIASYGQPVDVKMSHGGSGTQARAIIDGLDADVATLALWPDTDAIRKAGLISSGWEKQLPNNSVAYQSTIVFVVRKGNPKNIKDWPDIIKDGVTIVTPNPKTSGNGKLSFLAAWGAVTQRGGTDEEARAFVTKLYKQAPVLDLGARGSTVTFVEKKIGDVHLTWENEAHLEVKEAGGAVEIVYPPISFLVDPPLAVVSENVRRRGTGDAAKAYLEFLYTPEGQEIIARNFYRPIDPSVLSSHRATFPDLQFFKIDAVAKDWNDAYTKYFNEGGIFDAIYKAGRS